MSTVTRLGVGDDRQVPAVGEDRRQSRAMRGDREDRHRPVRRDAGDECHDRQAERGLGRSEARRQRRRRPHTRACRDRDTGKQDASVAPTHSRSDRAPWRAGRSRRRRPRSAASPSRPAIVVRPNVSNSGLSANQPRNTENRLIDAPAYCAAARSNGRILGAMRHVGEEHARREVAHVRHDEHRHDRRERRAGRVGDVARPG